MSRLVTPTIVTIYTDHPRNGGSPVKILGDWSALEWQESVSSSSRGYARFTVPVDSPSANAASILSVVRIIHTMANGTQRVWHYRITEAKDSLDKPEVEITCAPIIEDWGRFQMRSVVGGVPTKLVSFTGLRADEILSLVVIPALAAEGLTGITVGTVEDSARLSYSQSNVTPLGLLAWLEQQTKYEVWLEETSDTAATINLGTRGLDAPTPIAWVGRNVTALDRDIVVDEQFATRVEPIGNTLGETVTHAGQAMWEVDSVSGTDVVLVDPTDGNAAIGYDDEYNGNQAIVPLAPTTLYEQQQYTSVALDTTRRQVWLAPAGLISKVRWVDLVDGTSGHVSISTGTGVSGLVYSPSQDRIYALCVGATNIDVINPATKAIVASIGLAASWTNANAGSVANLGLAESVSRLVAMPNNGADSPCLINITTNAVVGALPSGFTDTHWSVYHTATNKYFLFGGLNYGACDGTTRANVHTGTFGSGVVAVVDDPSAANIHFWTADGKFQSINPATYAGSSVVMPTFRGAATTPSTQGHGRSVIRPFGGKYYFMSASFVCFDGTNILGGCDGPNAFNGLESVVYDTVNGYAYVFLDLVGIRTFRLADTPSEFDTFAITGTVEGTQVIQKGVGAAPILHAGQRLQIRETAGLEYKTRFSDPVSLATYGAIDAAPTLAVNALCNWWRGGALAEWRSDNTSRWISSGRVIQSQFGGMTEVFDTRWRAADYAPGISGITLTANVAFAAVTISLGNLGAGRVLQPGDILYNTVDSFPGHRMYVRKRTVADGAGNAVVPITIAPVAMTAGTVTLTLATVDVGLAEGQTDCFVSMPEGAGQTFRAFAFSAPIPRLSGDLTAWVTVHLKLMCNDVFPHDIQLRVIPPFGGAQLTVPIADDAEVTGSALREYWLSQRVDLTAWPGDGHIYARVDNVSGAPDCAMYVQSASIVLCPSSPVTDDVGFDIFASEYPNSLVSLAHLRLAQGGSPSVRYACTVAEDDPARPFAIGASVRLHDPARGITARPRIVSVTHFGSEVTDDKVPRPVIELSSAPLSLLRAITTLEANAA